MSRVLPILFNTEMVRAILDGRKTVTRRIVKHDTAAALNSPYHKQHPEVGDKVIIEKLCMPPYQIGDIMYIRETWAFLPCAECTREGTDCGRTCVTYGDKDSASDGCFVYRADHPHPEHVSWSPSIHMPKAAARIWLRVTDVRVERLQEITEEQLRKEGFIPEVQGHFKFKWIWDSAIKKSDLARYGWNANPWVWVIEFERCEDLGSGTEND